MKPTLIQVGLLLVTAAATPILQGCGESGGSKVDCAGMMSHYFGEGCTLYQGGDLLTEEGAVAWCESAKDRAPACECLLDLALLQICFEQIVAQDCNACDSEITGISYCLGSCT